tara:strand:- start:1258 stop:1614 length:357 start_codon:yes stop_codon:yes gene_type:complete
MSYGLMGVGRNTANEANAGFSSAAQLENNREMGNRQLASARDAQKKQTMGSLAGAGLQYGLTNAGGLAVANTVGAATGGLLGAGTAATAGSLATAGSAAGPWGALIGLGVGFLFDSLF